MTDHPLVPVLEQAKTIGLLGPGPVQDHIVHAEVYIQNLPKDIRRFIDLGSGAGLPGLPLLLARSEVRGVLLDASAKRCAFLSWAIVELGLQHRAEVISGRAEELAHDMKWRHQFDAAVGRGFGPPALTLEIARGFIHDHGHVLISEPPDLREWPPLALRHLGLEQEPAQGALALFRATGEVGTDVPRALKQLRSRPLF